MFILLQYLQNFKCGLLPALKSRVSDRKGCFYENPKNYEKVNPIEEVIGTVEKGFELFSSLGIGGMGTRGFGKIEVKRDNFLNEEKYWESVKSFIERLKEEKDKKK